MAEQAPGSVEEVRERIAAERGGRPFLLYADDAGRQRIVELPGGGRVTVGRRPANDVCLEWDGEVSRLHAELEWIGGEWTVADDGLSQNGSFLNGQRISGRRRLRDGDVLRFGATVVTFRAPQAGASEATGAAAADTQAELSDAQRRVLVALCRPFRDSGTFATPATNREIANELHLSVDAVKAHLRVLFGKFGVDELPQNQKRAQLVWRALQTGAVSTRDLGA